MKLVRSRHALAVIAFIGALFVAPQAIATPAHAATKSSNCTTTSLQRGDRGSCVKQLQTLLNKTSAKAGKADGSYGPKTESAVRQFQSDKKLKIDGKAGPETWGNLMVATRKLPTTAPTSCSKKTLRKGSRGSCVTTLQRRLALATFPAGRFGADGGFGKDTRDTVMDYQKFYGLKVDGVVDLKMWKHIVNHPNPPASRLKHLSKIRNYGGVNIVVDKINKAGNKAVVYVFEDGRLLDVQSARLGGRGVNQDGRKYDKKTPNGIFTIKAKILHGYSKLYEAEMPYSSCFTTNICFHFSQSFMHNGYGADGRSGSHGCVNMNMPAAEFIFDMAPKGTRVGVQS